MTCSRSQIFTWEVVFLFDKITDKLELKLQWDRKCIIVVSSLVHKHKEDDNDTATISRKDKISALRPA